MGFKNINAKALFIIPPFSDFYISQDRLYPNNAIYVSKMLQKLKVNTNIVDFRFGFKQKVKIPDNLSYLNDYYKKDFSKFSLFNDYNYYGITKISWQLEFYEKYIKLHGYPDIILITSNFTAYRSHSINVVKSVMKFFDDNTHIIIGGNDVIINKTWYESQINDIKNNLKLDNINVIIYDKFELDEFEKKIEEILEKLKEVKGIKTKKALNSSFHTSSFKEKRKKILGKIYKFYYLDKIFYYDNHKKEIKVSNPKNLYKAGSILLSSGCPYRCSYCFYSTKKFDKFYYRDKNEILKDLLALKEESFDKIHIEDDSFTAIKKEAIEILKILEIFTSNIHKFTFDFPNGVNYHKIDFEILQKFEKANIKSISIALGSFDEKILKKENRPSFKEEFLKFNRIIKNYNIEVLTYIIAGIPTQSFEEILYSFFLIFENDLSLGFSPYYPVINSVDYIRYKFESQLQKKGYDERFFASSSLFQFENTISTMEKATLFKIYRILSFLSHEKKNEKDYKNKIYNDYLKIISKCKQKFLETLKENEESRFDLIIEKEDIKFLESFLFILFLKTSNIYICYEKKIKGKDCIAKFEKFSASEKILLFYEKAKSLFLIC
jgi:hypothetical protein